MANELKHKAVGGVLTQGEFEASDGTSHALDSQATGDVIYASSSTVLRRLGIGSANALLSVGGSSVPAWTLTPTLTTVDVSTDFTVGDTVITNGVITDSTGLAVNAKLYVGSGTITAETAIELDHSTFVGSVDASMQSVLVTTALTEASSGTHAVAAGTRFAALSLTGAGGATTTAATVKIDGAPSGATNNYSLWVVGGTTAIDGALTHTGGAVSFNQDQEDYDFKIQSNNTDNVFHVDAGVNSGKGSVTFGYSANPDANNRAWLKVYPPAISTASGKSTSWVGIQPDYAMTMVGTVPVAATLAVEEPNISGTPTAAATVYIKDAPTEAGQSSYALWVDSGKVRVDEQLEFNSAPADESVSGVTATFTAGEDLVRGEVVYFKASDSKMWKAVATATGTMPVVAMAAEDVSADAVGVFLLYGFIADNGSFPAYTVGGKIYAPEAETGSQNVPEQTAPDSDGDFVQVLGYAVTANSLFFNPSNDVIEHA